MFTLPACSFMDSKAKEEKMLDFVLLTDSVVPEELKSIIDAKGEEAYKLTYKDDEYLYICVGYGKQKSDGYSIIVEKLCEREDAICVKCLLVGESSGNELMKDYCPRIVIRTKYSELPVIFE